MPTNLEKFNAELARATKDMTEDMLVEFQMMVAMEAFKRIVMRTPVDTGRARGNWQISIDREPEYELDAFDDPTLRELVNIQAARPYSTVFITNNVPYIFYLEYERRSSKSPEGMVEITLQELTNEFREYRKQPKLLL